MILSRFHRGVLLFINGGRRNSETLSEMRARRASNFIEIAAVIGVLICWRPMTAGIQLVERRRGVGGNRARRRAA